LAIRWLAKYPLWQIYSDLDESSRVEREFGLMFKLFSGLSGNTEATAARLIDENSVPPEGIPLPPIALNGVEARRDTRVFGEHPRVIIGDLVNRPLPEAKVIVVANEKGGVGKSTLAFHTAIALCDAGYRVAAIDMDPRQQTLARALAFREATAKRLDIELPSPKGTVINHTSGAMLCQEIARIGWKADYVVIDVAGSDSPLARRAIALADHLITPVNASFVDLDLIGRFHPTSHAVIGPGFFARMVNELRAERVAAGLGDTDWVVMPNRQRGGVSANQARFDKALAALAPEVGFRVATGLSDRVAYRELFLLGLTHLDLRHIPTLGATRSPARGEIRTLMAELGLAQLAMAELGMARKAAGKEAPLPAMA